MNLPLLTSLLLGSLVSQAQVGLAPTTAPPGTTTLRIQAAGPLDNVWVHTGQQLFARGYIVKYSDHSLGLLVTDSKWIAGTNDFLFLTVQVAPPTITLRGHYGSQVVTVGNRPKPMMEAMWQELEQVARTLGPAVRYAAQ